MARGREEDEADVALTEELRALLRPRARWPLVLLLLLLLALGVLALVASRTLRSGPGDSQGRVGGPGGPPDSEPLLRHRGLSRAG